MTDAGTVKRQIRRRIFQQDFAQGKAATSRFAGFFAVCSRCRGRGIVCKQYQNSAELCACDFCDGAGFVERTLREVEPSP